MKKLFFIFSFICLQFGATTMSNAQENTVAFFFNEEGKYIRPDSEKNYYVFEFDLNKETLENWFYDSIDRINDALLYRQMLLWKNDVPRYYYFLPSYDYDRQAGCVSIEYPVVSFADEYINNNSYRLQTKFDVQFKDGKIRINAPVLHRVNINNTSFYCYAEDWAKETFKRPGALTFLVNTNKVAAKLNAEYLNNYINAIFQINKSTSDFSNPIVLESPDECLFHLDNETASFLFDNNKNYINVSMPGYSKDNLKTFLIRTLYLTKTLRTNNGYNEINRWNYTDMEVREGKDDLQITIRHNIKTDRNNPFLRTINWDFRVILYYVFNDDVIQVYAPKVFDIETFGKTHHEKFVDYTYLSTCFYGQEVYPNGASREFSDTNYAKMVVEALNTSTL